MEKKITRTIKTYKLIIRDSQTGAILKSEVTHTPINRKTAAIKFIKETGNTSFLIDIVETEELREMSLETFMANSTVVGALVEESPPNVNPAIPPFTWPTPSTDVKINSNYYGNPVHG